MSSPNQTQSEVEEKTIDQAERSRVQEPREETDLQPSERTRTIRGPRWYAIAVAILSNLLFYAIDTTIVAVIQPDIVRNLGQVQNLPWLAVGFLLPGAMCALLLGQIYSIFNSKYLYILFAFLFLVGSAICGAAPNMTAMILGRVIGGLGGTGMYLGALTLLSVLTNPKEMSAYMGYVALVFGFGSVIGPLIGGAFAVSGATWRWGFYISVVILGCSIPIYLFLLPSYTPHNTSSTPSYYKKIDFIGALLSMGMYAAGVMALNFGGILYSWNSTQEIVLFVFFGTLAILLLFQQIYCVGVPPTSRLMPVHLFNNKDIIICTICQFAVAFTVQIPIYYIPIFFEFARNNSAIRGGIKLLPFICTWVTTSVARGHLMAKFGWYKPWYLIGSGLQIVGASVLSVLMSSTNDGVNYGMQVFLGVGLGCYGQAGFAVAQRLVPSNEVHHALSLMLIAQITGTTIGIAAAGAIFQNTALPSIQHVFPLYSQDQISKLISGVDSSPPAHLSVEDMAAVSNILATAAEKPFILIYTAAAIAFVGSMFFTSKKIF